MFQSSFSQTAAYRRWRNIGGRHRLGTDEDIACFLMNCYDEKLSQASGVKECCSSCGCLLVRMCYKCGGFAESPGQDYATFDHQDSCSVYDHVTGSHGIHKEVPRLNGRQVQPDLGKPSHRLDHTTHQKNDHTHQNNIHKESTDFTVPDQPQARPTRPQYHQVQASNPSLPHSHISPNPMFDSHALTYPQHGPQASLNPLVNSWTLPDRSHQKLRARSSLDFEEKSPLIHSHISPCPSSDSQFSNSPLLDAQTQPDKHQHKLRVRSSMECELESPLPDHYVSPCPLSDPQTRPSRSRHKPRVESSLECVEENQEKFEKKNEDPPLLDPTQDLYAEQLETDQSESESELNLSGDSSSEVIKEVSGEIKEENSEEKNKKRKRKSQLPNELFCGPCKKQLSSRQAFDRHLTSKLHAIALLPPDVQAKRRRRQKVTNPQQANQDKSVYFVVKKEGREEYQCKVCGQGFNNVEDVKQHRRQHKNREMCHLCGKTVNVRGFRDHMLRHRGERQFFCSQCPKTFINAGLLRDHAIVHTNEKPYCCEVCGACFRHRHTLKYHLRTHAGVKAYRCSQCDASFTRPRGLSDHMRVHTGEKPYRCQVCGRCFSSSGNLAAHRRKVHKMAPLRPNVPSRLLIT